jgi:hypothetical protein
VQVHREKKDYAGKTERGKMWCMQGWERNRGAGKAGTRKMVPAVLEIESLGTNRYGNVERRMYGYPEE